MHYFDEFKRSGLCFVIGGFQSFLCVSVFQGLLLVIVIMIDGSEKCMVKVAFELKSLHVCKKCSSEWWTARLKPLSCHGSQ